ncbi:hypothetical protein [Bradyrhizobium sp. BR2003]|uniref:hypothetical protein n=1 Tax=Bradyrhizobium sp. BR2003 TaxID=1419258 RepID=UPI0014857BE3|nr:hypothetical protein [Bradyrhizobium sp. BR2003]
MIEVTGGVVSPVPVGAFVSLPTADVERIVSDIADMMEAVSSFRRDVRARRVTELFQTILFVSVLLAWACC